MNVKKVITTALFGLCCQLALAQGVRISGTLSDSDGPIMMGNVVEVDANNRIVSATQTDFNGNFSMQVKSTANKLKFSYVGDKEKVVSIGSQTSFKIVLQPASTQLKEVKIVGRRGNSGGLMMQKKEISTASQVMSMESVEGLAFTSADEALQGEIAGLDIVSNSGNLGAGTQMRLRGVSTLSANANPLIVVDDKIFDNPDENFDWANADEEQYSSLLSVNVEDIASIEVLKDAAATAVWGTKASNGVIMITTKRGTRGKPRVDFSYKFTGTWMPKGYKLLNGDDYTMMLKEEFYNPTQQSDRTQRIQELNYNKAGYGDWENWNNNTDWVDAVSQFGTQQEYNLNLNGGGEKATFRISAGYKHQTGTIIKQKLQQFTTRMALDYNVSDRIRFMTNFALTYTNNDQNYKNLLGIAQNQAPNMSIYRQDGNGTDTDEYFLMYPTAPNRNTDITKAMYSSYDLSGLFSLGNPVAIGNLAWQKDRTYRLTPDFTIKYEILGIENEKSRLTFNGRVDFDIFAESKPSYYPAALANTLWTGGDYNKSTNYEFNRMKIGGRAELVFTPYIRNKDWTSTMLLRYEMNTSKSTNQTVVMNHLPNDITSPTVNANPDTPSSYNSRYNTESVLYNGHVAYKDGRYSLQFTLRADGDSKFGPKNKWSYSPGISLRYNIIDEPFMKWSHSFLSMLGLRASWGKVGKGPDADYLFFNTYDVSAGSYGKGTTGLANYATIDGMRLDNLRPEKKTEWNFGFNLGLLEDRFELDFNYYTNEIRDMLMSKVAIPSFTGYPTLATSNVGRMTNQGWELNFTAKKFIKVGKFSADFSMNMAQNTNLLKEMDPSVLQDINGTTWDPSVRGTYPVRVQINNSLGSIYGFRYQGVYNMSWDYLQNYKTEMGLSATQYEDWINGLLHGTLPDEWYADRNLEKRPYTAPVVVANNGNVIMTNTGNPQRMIYAYGTAYETNFQGGDAKYEDINHDGQINALDIVYLGNSLPKINGGFNFSLNYGKWTLKARFFYRFGNKVINSAKMSLENMYETNNQSATVNYRWRKDGDVTPMPRAMYHAGYNWQNSDRYVEDGGFVRFQNLQLGYKFDSKLIKQWGLRKLEFYGSLNNIYVWTKYSGTDPEWSMKGYAPATDSSKTPRSKYFTLTLNLGF
jgi:TonB-linked SusC/RagA family outer membrane protein